MESGIKKTLDFSGSSGFTLRLTLEETWDIVGNYSVVSIAGMSVKSTIYGGTWSPSGTVSINGMTVGVMDYYYPATHSVNFPSVGETWRTVQAINQGAKFPWKSGNIVHDNEGKKTVDVSVKVNLWRSSSDPIVAFAGTQKVSLTTIPRASTVYGEAGKLGTQHILSISRKIRNFTDTIVAKCGSESITVVEKTSENSVAWIPPVYWSENNTTGTSVSVAIICTSYSGSTKIGSTETTITMEIPESIVPTAEISASNPDGHLAKYGAYVQNKSKVRVQVVVEGAYGSQVKNCVITVGGSQQLGTEAVFELKESGQADISAAVTDSRGRTTTTKISVDVLAYSPPSASIVSAYRSDATGNQDDDGVYAAVLFSANITPLNNKNAKVYSVKYRVKGRNAWTEMQIPDDIGYSPSSAMRIIPASADKAYEIAVTAADDFAEVTSIYRTVQVAFYLISVNKSTKAVGIGQKATEPGMCAFGIPAKFNLGIFADGKYLFVTYNEEIEAYVLKEGEAPGPDISESGINIFDDGAGNVMITTFGDVIASNENGHAAITGPITVIDDGYGNVILGGKE